MSKKYRVKPAKTSHIVEKEDGTVFYKGVASQIRVIYMIAAAILLAMLGLLLALAGEHVNIPVIVLIAVALMAYVFIHEILFGGKRSKSVELTSDTINIELKNGKLISFEYQYLIDVEPIRHHNKYGSYTYTDYGITYLDSETGTPRKVYFNSQDPLAISDFVYRVQKKVNSTQDAEFDTLYSPKSFEWDKSVGGVSVAGKIILGLIIFFVGFMIWWLMKIVFISYDSPKFAIFAFTMCVPLLAVASVAMALNVDKVVGQAPDTLKFDMDKIIINDTTVDRIDIKYMLITPVGTGNPRESNNSTLDIYTNNGRIKVLLGIFYPDENNSLSKPLGEQEWAYFDLHKAAHEWGKAHGVKVIDYIA